MVSSLFPDSANQKRSGRRLLKKARKKSDSQITASNFRHREQIKRACNDQDRGHHQGCFHGLHHSLFFSPNIIFLLITWTFHILYPDHTSQSSHVHSPTFAMSSTKEKERRRKQKQKERKTTTTKQVHFLLSIYSLEDGHPPSGQHASETEAVSICTPAKGHQLWRVTLQHSYHDVQELSLCVPF